MAIGVIALGRLVATPSSLPLAVATAGLLTGSAAGLAWRRNTELIEIQR